MRFGKKYILAAIVLIIAAAAVGCSSAGARPAAPTPDNAAAVKVSALTINPPETRPGIQLIITAKVTNSGDRPASYKPRIRIDDAAGGSLPTYRYQPDVPLAPGATQLVSFVVDADAPGSFRVTWGDQTGDFTVVPADTTGAAGTDGQTPAPDFTGVDVVTNQKVTLSQFRGRVVLLNFVNYGCDPSVNGIVSNELLAIKQLTQQRSDFVPVSVFCGCCPPDVLRSFAKENQLNWPWLLDADSSIVQKYLDYLRNYGYPTLVFIDADGNITGSAGYTDLSGLSAKLDQMVGRQG